MTARRFMVVDWSVLMYMNWHKMKSPNFESRTGLELAEFARNIASHALYLVERVKPDVLVLAVDSAKNWRSDVYARFYLHNVEFKEYREKPGIWAVQFDRKTYLVTFRQDMGKWEFKKLPKADVLALELEDPTQWRTWSSCPVEPVEEDPEGEAVRWVQESEDWPHLEPIVPKYKGNRSSSRWDYETPKSEFKVLGANLAHSMAGALGGHAVQVDLAEGDDIVATFVGMVPPEDEVVLVSIDSDLHQLLVDRPDLRIFDPKLHKWIEKTPELALFEVTHKVLTGDTSDNIAGIALAGAAATLGDKGAEKVISDNGGPVAVWDYLRGVKDGAGKWIRKPAADLASLDRNVELVLLDMIPAALVHQIQDAIRSVWTTAPVAEYGFQDAGMTAADVISTRAMGRSDKELDDGIRDGDPINHDTIGKAAP